MGGCVEKAVKDGYCNKHKTNALKKDKVPDPSTKTCMVNGCTMSRMRNGNFCLSHTCNKTGCRSQKKYGSTYCRVHAESKK